MAQIKQKEITGIFVPDGNSRPDKRGKINFKRFQVQGEDLAIRGSIYIPYAAETPNKIVLVAA